MSDAHDAARLLGVLGIHFSDDCDCVTNSQCDARRLQIVNEWLRASPTGRPLHPPQDGQLSDLADPSSIARAWLEEHKPLWSAHDLISLTRILEEK